MSLLVLKVHEIVQGLLLALNKYATQDKPQATHNDGSLVLHKSSAAGTWEGIKVRAGSLWDSIKAKAADIQKDLPALNLVQDTDDSDTWKDIRGGIDDLGDYIKSKRGTILKYLPAMALGQDTSDAPILRSIGARLGRLGDYIKSKTGDAWKDLPALNLVQDTDDSDTWQGIKDGAGSLWNSIKSGTGAIWKGLTAPDKERDTGDSTKASTPNEDKAGDAAKLLLTLAGVGLGGALGAGAMDLFYDLPNRGNRLFGALIGAGLLGAGGNLLASMNTAKDASLIDKLRLRSGKIAAKAVGAGTGVTALALRRAKGNSSWREFRNKVQALQPTQHTIHAVHGDLYRRGQAYIELLKATIDKMDAKAATRLLSRLRYLVPDAVRSEILAMDPADPRKQELAMYRAIGANLTALESRPYRWSRALGMGFLPTQATLDTWASRGGVGTVAKLIPRANTRGGRVTNSIILLLLALGYGSAMYHGAKGALDSR